MNKPTKSPLDAYREARDDLEGVIDAMATHDAVLTKPGLKTDERERIASEIDGMISSAESKAKDLKPLFDRLDAYRKGWYSAAQQNVDRFIAEQKQTLASVRRDLAIEREKP